jgi:hypothetical protein
MSRWETVGFCAVYRRFEPFPSGRLCRRIKDLAEFWTNGRIKTGKTVLGAHGA